MKTTIDHLPEEKQRKLREITAIFTESRDGSPIGMLILFGSHARGDWVEDAETGYKSDYDFLVVVETEAQVADVMLWGEIEQRVRAIIGDTPLTLIVHDVKFVNGEIRIGQYFFVRPVPPKGCLHPGWGPKTRKGGRRKILENLCAVQV
jgi:predicted nucleotidyltransferase